MSKSKIQSHELDQLIDAFLKIKDKDTWYKVLEDLCTIQEIKDLSLRFDVANKLSEGQSYQAISEKTKASSTTISRVAKALGYGEGGYQSMIKKKTTSI
jgi:TrpR-related protein YerC/YecD